MKRQEYRVILSTDDDPLYREVVAYALNSGVRKSEALVRDLARDKGTVFTGEKPARDETGYRRVWTDPQGNRVTAYVFPPEKQ